MSWLNKILSLLWRSWFVFLASLGTIIFGVFFIYPLSFRTKDYSKAYFFLRLWAKLVFYGSGLRLKTHKPNQFNITYPSIIIANHTSMMDIMLMYILHKEPIIFVGKEELCRLPVFGLIFKRLNITVDRSNPKSRIKVFREARKQLLENKSICIFPEGGVPDEVVFLDEFQEGSFAIAIMNKVPIINYTICGMKRILPYAYFRGRPGKVNVYLNEIQLTSDLTKNDMKNIKQHHRGIILERLRKCVSCSEH